LRFLGLWVRHREIKKKVLVQAALFQEKQGYRPPYWELFRMTNRARIELQGQSR
jgi:hypothetical protein